MFKLMFLWRNQHQEANSNKPMYSLGRLTKSARARIATAISASPPSCLQESALTGAPEVSARSEGSEEPEGTGGISELEDEEAEATTEPEGNEGPEGTEEPEGTRASEEVDGGRVCEGVEARARPGRTKSMSFVSKSRRGMTSNDFEPKPLR